MEFRVVAAFLIWQMDFHALNLVLKGDNMLRSFPSDAPSDD